MTATNDTAIKRKRAIKRKLKVASDLFAKKGANVSATCLALKICRKTWYRWLEKYPSFAGDIDDVREGMIDFAESKLVENIKDGKETSLIFFLKTQAKARGYVERLQQEVDLSSRDGSMKPAPTIDCSKMSTEALDELINATSAKP